MVLWCALNLDTGYVDSGASCEEFLNRHRSATTSVLAGATDELQSDLLMVSSCVLGEAKL